MGRKLDADSHGLILLSQEDAKFRDFFKKD